MIKNIIFIADFGWGGLGDMFRCLLNMYAYCRKNDVEFFINFETLRSDIGVCFDYKKYNGKYIIQREFCHTKEDFFKIMEKQIPAIGITSNIYDIQSVNDRKEWIESFKEIIKPSQVVEDYIKNNFFLTEPYISVHIRFGDYTIKNAPSNYTEKRLDINPDLCFQVGKILTQISMDNPGKIIVIHSDNDDFKTQVSETLSFVKSFSNTSSHTAENTSSSIPTISEFFFISRANKVIQLFNYSGFAHLASVYGEVPFEYNYETNDIISKFS